MKGKMRGTKKNYFQGFKNPKKSNSQDKFGHTDIFPGSLEEDEGLETIANYKKIWGINPSFKDINLFVSFIRAFFLIITGIFLLGTMQLISNDFILTTILTSIILFSFVIIFREAFFGFEFFISSFFKNFLEFDLFKNLKFFILKNDKHTLYIANNDLRIVANRIFKLNFIPDNINENINQFLKSLSSGGVRIPFSYQVIQSPLLSNSRFPAVDSHKSFKTSIYISVHCFLTGILTQSKLLTLLDDIEEYSDTLKSFLVSNYHHFKFSILHGNDLINAIRTILTKQEIITAQDINNDSSKNKDYFLLIRLIYTIFFLSFCFAILLVINIPLLNSFIVVLIFFFLIIILFWRDSLFQMAQRLKIKDKIIELYPFKDINFYFLKKVPNAIFIKSNNLLIATKIFNLVQAHPLDSKFYFTEKFFEAMIYHQTPFAYTLINSSLTFKKFLKISYKYLNNNAKKWVLGKKSTIEGEEWLQLRSGIWRTILLLSVSKYERVSPMISNNALAEKLLLMDEKLSKTIKIVKNSFETSFRNFYLENLSKNRLNSALATSFVKTKFYKLGGTHLNYLLFQGKELINPLKIVNEFKKGIDSSLGAEFNTPLFLKNDIVFGKTINTEFLETETPAGFTLEQIKNLLITNGSKEDREKLRLKIVSELVKSNVPSIVFDFTGNFSILLNYFKGTQYENNFLHFKLGSSFNINLIHSGMRFDKNNLDYLDLVFDAFGIAMKEEKSVITAFKNSILDNQELDLSTIALNIQNQQRWEKDYKTESLIQLIRHLPRDTLIVSGKIENQEDDFNLNDILTTDKTIIIDLSIQKDTQTKVFFTFILLSKIIHYIKNSTNFKQKILVVPSVDSFFDANFLDTKMKDYGKIDKFLDPLIQENFGLLFSCNQVRYLHQNMFNYLNNIITFRTYDNRDISAFIPLLNLRTDESGIYSSRRNETYQTHYLINMKNNEMLVKRSDIYQPFPCILECHDLLKLKPLNSEYIVRYMLKQGYDLSITEKRLKIEKTILEKDFKNFEGFTEEIINFLNAISSLHDVGNLYERKVKEHLLEYIYEKAQKITQNKKHILKFRDDIFDTLISHRYLVENHPKTAGGSESMMVSYRVGSQFTKALTDYFETKKDAKTSVNLDILEKESSEDYSLPQDLELEDVNNIFSKKIETEIGALAYNISEMKDLIDINNFSRALIVGKNLLKSFLNTLHAEFRQTNLNGNGLATFLNSLCLNKVFPLTKEELLKFVEQQKSIESSKLDTKSKSIDIYSLLNTFLIKLLRV